MPSREEIANPKSRYGAAKAATRSFMLQRISGALNVLFLGFLVWLVLRLAGTDRAEMVAVVANPFIAAIIALLIVNVSIHMRIGMREVIEDYVHDERLNKLSLFANTAFAVMIAALTLLALLKLVFWN